MRVDALQLANFRALESADLSFAPGFNLLVGVNGVGKTSVLDALRICFSRVLPAASPSRARAMSFRTDDIRVGRPYVEASMRFTLAARECHFERREWRESIAIDDEKNLEELRRQIREQPRLSDRARNLLRELSTTQSLENTDFFEPDPSILAKEAEGSAYAPLVIFYGVGRSVISRKAPASREGGTQAAYAEALVERPMRLTHLARWVKVQATLAEERELSAKHLESVVSVASRFIPELTNLRSDSDKLLIDKGGVELDVAWLSEGERGTLAIAMDIARRLSQANPNLDDPTTEAGAIVLIDEIDLHLHPKLQREIIHALTTTFPRCQFIATTHSPQVISEVPHDRVQIMTPECVYSPDHTYGIDSSRVLEEIMDVTSRPKAIEEMLKQIALLSRPETIGLAREALRELADKLELGENDPEVTRLRTLLDFMEGYP